MSALTPKPTLLAHIEGQPTPEQLAALQARMADMGGNTFGPTPEHLFADGVYGRKVVIPGGWVLLGRLQRKANLTIQLYGDCEIIGENGPQRIVGTQVFRVPPMVKRLMVTHAETCWLTVHATEETDMAKVEDELIVTEADLPRMYLVAGGEK